MIHSTCLDWYGDLPAEYSQGTGCKCCIEHLLPFQGRLCIAELNCVHSSFIGVETTRIDLAWLVMFQISFTTCVLGCQVPKMSSLFDAQVNLWTTFCWDRSDIYIYIYIYTIRPSSYSLWTWIRYPLHPPMLPQEAKDPIYLQERQVAKLQRSVIARNSGDMARNGLIGNAWDRVGW